MTLNILYVSERSCDASLSVTYVWAVGLYGLWVLTVVVAIRILKLRFVPIPQKISKRVLIPTSVCTLHSTTLTVETKSADTADLRPRRIGSAVRRSATPGALHRATR